MVLSSGALIQSVARSTRIGEIMECDRSSELPRRERDDLEGAGMTLRAIDDAVADLRLRGVSPFTLGDIIEVAARHAALLAQTPIVSAADEWMALG
jgi:hypothetical protein